MKCEIMEDVLWMIGLILWLQLITGNTKGLGPTIAVMAVVWYLIEPDSTVEDNKK
jgi:hypothetical protein